MLLLWKQPNEKFFFFDLDEYCSHKATILLLLKYNLLVQILSGYLHITLITHLILSTSSFTHLKQLDIMHIKGRLITVL